MVVSPANRPGGRGDNCAETGAVTAGLLGATSRLPRGVWCVPGWPVTIPPWYVTTRNARIDVGLGEGLGSI